MPSPHVPTLYDTNTTPTLEAPTDLSFSNSPASQQSYPSTSSTKSNENNPSHDQILRFQPPNPTMVRIQTFALLAVATLHANNEVQADSLADAPYIARDGPMTLDENCMVRGTRIDPNANKAIFPNATNQAAPTTNDGADIMDYPMTARDNREIKKVEEAYKIDFIKNADEIMKNWPRGQAKKTPWPGSYWPLYKDGINARSNGGPSAAEKYARANNLNVQEFMNKVSKSSGIEWTLSGPVPSTPCRTKNECQGAKMECAKREGKDSGYCIPTWEGICHAWAPAAVLEDEPKCPVTIGGVSFQPNDIKGLIATVYDKSGIKALNVGIRFDGGDDDKRDDYGRFTDGRRRDVSPAAFHLACANMLGRSGRSFIVDADAGPQVWNQPARSYEFTDVVTMDPQQASLRFFSRSTYPFNKDAKKIQYVKTIFKYIQEPSDEADGELATPERVDRYTTTKKYEYVLELDGQNNILGGEWVGTSREEHPDFMWFQTEAPKENFVTEAGISFAFVRKLIQMSRSRDC